LERQAIGRAALGWPNIGFDFVPVMKQLEVELARHCPGFQCAEGVPT
jgi:hypothetical protein